MNETFQWLSPAAVVERCILCVHGGIGRIKWLRQLESLTKPCAGVQELMEAQDSRGANGPGSSMPEAQKAAMSGAARATTNTNR